MALTQISTAGVKDDAVTSGKIPANAVGSSELADNAVDTAAIADQAVALSKLPHGDSNNNGKFLRANNGADPSFETITGTTINNNADNRVITGSGTANTLNAESSVIIDANGRLGIDIASPAFKLESNGGVDNSVCFAGRSDGGNGNNARFTFKGFAHGGGANYGGGFKLQTRDTTNNFHDRLTVDSSGNVGINTTSSHGKLQVHDGSIVHSKPAGGGTRNWKFVNNNTAVGDYGIQISTTETGTTYVNHTELKAGGDVHIHDGNLVVASGHGIDFSATGDASGMTSELLDDYEEGTFSPIPNAGGGVTFTYAHNTGFYTKIGNTVTFQIYLMFYASTITGGNSGNGVAIQGLPFTIKNNGRYNPAFTVGRTYNFNIASDKRIYAYGEDNSTNIRMIVESDDTVGALLTAGQVDQSTCLTFISGTYQI